MTTTASPPAPRRPLRRHGLLALAAAGGAAVVLGPLLGWQLSRGHAADPSPLAPVRVHIGPLVSPQGFLDDVGVRVVRAALSGDGGLIDVRYQVIDPDKAAVVHAAGSQPLLLDRRNGAVLSELFMGHAHHGRPTAGVTYYLIFMNSGDAVRRGDRLMVQLGGERVGRVTVQ